MKPRILLIYTGGTIGMMAHPVTGELQSLRFDYIQQQIPEIQQLAIEVLSVSIAQPLDSSEMHPKQWIELTEIIEAHASHMDGFVILHGTDTLAYTASALSFMVQNLGKPIIITGSQLPVGILRSDGKENLLAALEIAAKKDQEGNAAVKEVAVFFQSKLFRGNRVSKVSAHQFDAFDAPNYPALGFAGVEIEIHPALGPSSAKSQPTFYKELATDVGLVKLFPGIRLVAYASVFQVAAHRAVVIESFGAGNTPNDAEFSTVLQNYVVQGGILVTISQCIRGGVRPGQYASGKLLEQLESWNGKNMTTEAAITKLMWMLGQAARPSQQLFEQALCGEIS